jgi:hypothetical protein
MEIRLNIKQRKHKRCIFLINLLINEVLTSTLLFMILNNRVIISKKNEPYI